MKTKIKKVKFYFKKGTTAYKLDQYKYPKLYSFISQNWDTLREEYNKRTKGCATTKQISKRDLQEIEFEMNKWDEIILELNLGIHFLKLYIHSPSQDFISICLEGRGSKKKDGIKIPS